MFIANLRIRKCLGGIEKNNKSKPPQFRRCASRDSKHKRRMQVTKSVIASADLLCTVVQFLGQMNTICRRNTTMEWVRVVLPVELAKRGRTHTRVSVTDYLYEFQLRTIRLLCRIRINWLMTQRVKSLLSSRIATEQTSRDSETRFVNTCYISSSFTSYDLHLYAPHFQVSHPRCVV